MAFNEIEYPILRRKAYCVYVIMVLPEVIICTLNMETKK